MSHTACMSFLSTVDGEHTHQSTTLVSRDYWCWHWASFTTPAEESKYICSKHTNQRRTPSKFKSPTQKWSLILDTCTWVWLSWMISNLTSQEEDAGINRVLSRIFVLLIMETNSLLLHYTMSIFSITDSKAQVLIYHPEFQDLPHCKLSPIVSSKD